MSLYCLFSWLTLTLVSIYTLGLIRHRVMASSSPTTSIPIQEPVFLQFLHDVHHAYLLLHRAMALLSTYSHPQYRTYTSSQHRRMEST